MRIVGYIEHPVLKISVFSWSEKYIVKIEAGLFEQSYKFRQADFGQWEDLKAFFDADMISDIMTTFKKMSADASASAKRLSSSGKA
ncbi:MAG TPA: hypothetical protein PLL28_13190 [Chitinophagales bacterium]|nr:hypothetical protein [Chitinophagales bacterium]